MVAGAAVTFPAVGYLSDRIGRRRVVVPALLLAIAAAVVMPAWPSLAGLIAGRLLAGAAVGLMASTATAYIADLHRAAHSGRPGRPGSPGPGRISATANLGGLALGPLAAGALAAWVSFPLGRPTPCSPRPPSRNWHPAGSRRPGSWRQAPSCSRRARR